jgi:hypothetical protein
MLKPIVGIAQHGYGFGTRAHPTARGKIPILLRKDAADRARVPLVPGAVILGDESLDLPPPIRWLNAARLGHGETDAIEPHAQFRIIRISCGASSSLLRDPMAQGMPDAPPHAGSTREQEGLATPAEMTTPVVEAQSRDRAIRIEAWM